MKSLFFAVAMTLSMTFSMVTFAQDVPHTVTISTVEDLKAVYSTVESVDVVTARTRIGGTLVEVNVDEGSIVKAGQVIARVVDKKLGLKVKSIDARLLSLAARRDLAKTALARLEKLFLTGAVSKVRLDEARTGLDVSERALTSAQAERQVLMQTRNEGNVLSAANGRILTVNVTQGGVALPGEAVAQIAAEGYILRLQVPERHARFMREGDTVQVAEQTTTRPGIIRQVYPEIKQGRVFADVEVDGLGDFFVGERIRVWIGTGKRTVLVVPETYIYHRYGLTYVKLQSGHEVVVQLGLAHENGFEILSGLQAGDVLLASDHVK